VPPEAKDDKALKMADDLLHGIKSSATTPAPVTPATSDKASIDGPQATRPKAAN